MSLRIVSPTKDGRPRRNSGEQELEPDFYMSRLIKLIPAEAVAIYPLLHSRADGVIKDVEQIEAWEKRKGQGFTQPVDSFSTEPIGPGDVTNQAIERGPEFLLSPFAREPDHWLIIAMAWLTLVLVIVVRWQATRDPFSGHAQWGAVAIAAISFFLWVPTMNGSFGIMELASNAGLIDWKQPVQDFIPELALIFWTLIVPVFYRPGS